MCAVYKMYKKHELVTFFASRTKILLYEVFTDTFFTYWHSFNIWFDKNDSPEYFFTKTTALQSN